MAGSKMEFWKPVRISFDDIFSSSDFVFVFHFYNLDFPSQFLGCFKSSKTFWSPLEFFFIQWCVCFHDFFSSEMSQPKN